MESGQPALMLKEYEASTAKEEYCLRGPFEESNERIRKHVESSVPFRYS